MSAMWQERGACVGMPVVIWFEPIPSYVSRARFVCSLCPAEVRAACLNDAIERQDREGIRGGLLPSERPVLRRPMTRVAA